MNIRNKTSHIPPIDPATGRRLLHGNGCDKYPNCLTCPYEKCTFGAKGNYRPYRYSKVLTDRV